MLGAWRWVSLARAYYIDNIIDSFLFFSTTYVGVSGDISEKTAVISEEEKVTFELIFLLFMGVAPGGRSRAMRIELLLEPLIWKMLTHFGLRLPLPRRGTSFDITTLFCLLKCVYKIKFSLFTIHSFSNPNLRNDIKHIFKPYQIRLQSVFMLLGS